MHRRALRYVFAALLAVAVVHLACSAAVVIILRTHFAHRAPNIATMTQDGPEREVIASAFTVESFRRTMRSGKPMLMFLGSSVSYGYPWQEPVIFTRQVAEALPRRETVNLSIVGAHMRALTDFATCAIEPQRRPDVLVVEIPLVNSVATIRTDARFPGRRCKHPGAAAGGYWRLALANPLAIGWAARLWDNEAYAKPDQALQVAKVPADYFADRQSFAAIETAFVAELRRFLTEVSTMGNMVYVYVSPIYTPAIEQAGGDRLSVEHQIALANAVCQEVKGVVCLDTRPFGTQKDLFYNLTHLNQRGHRALADWFLRQVPP
jgi:hypothetical protein